MENYIGDNIHAIRGNFGLSQEQLAAIAEVSQTSVSAWGMRADYPAFFQCREDRRIFAQPDYGRCV